ncbi:MAG: B12-binding domain-containing radical SAM protein [Firmicutes bacterium]|nr:B12-binding domain-containing radical SAM protein [Bacillota bacterium]
MDRSQQQRTPVALASLNAKYIHSNLAIDYLRSYCEARQIPAAFHILEFHINEPVEFIVGEILSLGIDIIGFSCYIWNINETLHVISRLKLAKPEMIVIVGGPEVSYEARALMDAHPEIDYCITGEGEKVFAGLLMQLLSRHEGCGNGQGRPRQRIISGEPVDLGELPSPYPEGIGERYRNKLVYLETSRGCPFNCQYCLSANTPGVRYFPWERVRGEFIRLMDAGVPQVKLIDRTFNANPKWALKVFRLLVDESRRRGAFDSSRPPTIFHFEISADILTEELIEYLAAVPSGLLQFEIGIQSTTPAVLEAISRKSKWEQLARNIRALAEKGNIHLHLDLIAGLPEETYASFSRSFDDVYSLGGHRIQLGFLKLLKGSGLRNGSEELGLVFDPCPPYEIISTASMTALELVRLKEVENVLELYHNSHRFGTTMHLLSGRVYASPFVFFENLARYFRRRGLHRLSHSQQALYNILYQFLREHHPDILPLAAETLKFDYLRTERHRPLLPWMPGKLGKDYKHIWQRLLNNPDVLAGLNPATAELPRRELAQNVRVAGFSTEFVGFLRDGSLPARFIGNSVIIGEMIGDSGGWVIFDHHRSDPWTRESAYTLVLSE